MKKIKYIVALLLLISAMVGGGAAHAVVDCFSVFDWQPGRDSWTWIFDTYADKPDVGTALEEASVEEAVMLVQRLSGALRARGESAADIVAIVKIGDRYGVALADGQFLLVSSDGALIERSFAGGYFLGGIKPAFFNRETKGAEAARGEGEAGAAVKNPLVK